MRLECDLVALCRELNGLEARYSVIGGFAIIAAGLPRTTGDIDLIVASDRQNEAKGFGFNEPCPLGRAQTILPSDSAEI
jgi:hypothetical protein